MRHSIKIGFTFGLTSGIITTLGLMIGLHSGTHSKLAVIGGILIIAIADAFSDALGIHLSEESENVHTHREVWVSTISTFVSKFVVACTFVLPVIFLDLSMAMIVSIAWGLLLLGILSYFMAVDEKEKPWKVIGEHLSIAIIVVVSTHFTGELIARFFSKA